MELLNVFNAIRWVIDDAIPSLFLVLGELFAYAPPFLQGFLILNLVAIVIIGLLRLITG